MRFGSRHCTKKPNTPVWKKEAQGEGEGMGEGGGGVKEHGQLDRRDSSYLASE